MNLHLPLPQGTALTTQRTSHTPLEAQHRLLRFSRKSLPLPTEKEFLISNSKPEGLSMPTAEARLALVSKGVDSLSKPYRKFWSCFTVTAPQLRVLPPKVI